MTPTTSAKGMTRLALSAAALAAALATCPALAQIIPTGTPAADILLSQALGEQRVFLTCSAAIPDLHAQLLRNWQRDVEAASKVLADRNVPTATIAAFRTAAEPTALISADDTLWYDVRQLCASNPDWPNDIFGQKFIELARKLPDAFE